MSALDTIVAAVLPSVLAQRGVAITYHRGATEIALTAIPGRTDWAAGDTQIGTPAIAWESRDYLFAAASLAGFDLTTPQRGDYVTEGNRRYDVMAPANLQHWRYTDPGRQWIRVHTKLTESA